MLSPMVAIKQYIERGSTKPVTSRELIDFKKVCSEQEWAEFGATAEGEGMVTYEVVWHLSKSEANLASGKE